MKDNQDKQLFTELTAEFEAPAFKELNDEVAATCSGGLAPVTLYEDVYYGGAAKDIYGNDDNLDNSIIGNGWNNRTSSIIVREGTWQIFDKEDYDVTGRSAILRPGRYPLPNNFALANDSLTGIRRLT